MHSAGGLGWAVCLLFAVCCALRLARFNTKLDNTDLPAWTSRFFTGVPAPARAGLALLPIFAPPELAPGLVHPPVVLRPLSLLDPRLYVNLPPIHFFKRPN